MTTAFLPRYHGVGLILLPLQLWLVLLQNSTTAVDSFSLTPKVQQQPFPTTNSLFLAVSLTSNRIRQPLRSPAIALFLAKKVDQEKKQPRVSTSTIKSGEDVLQQQLHHRDDDIVDKFWNSYFQGSDHHDDLTDAFLECLDDDIEWDDSTISTTTLKGKIAVERHLRLWHESMSEKSRCVIDQRVVGIGLLEGAASANSKGQQLRVAVQFHWEDFQPGGTNVTVPNSRGMAWFTTEIFFVEGAKEKIKTVLWVQESWIKSGEAGLKLLSVASPILGGGLPSSLSGGYRIDRGETDSDHSTCGDTLPERYFAAWNRRDMDTAVALFTEDVIYDDTAFDLPFSGHEALLEHLNKCARALPPTFRFAPEQLLEDEESIAVRWHVESNGKPIPFTRGCSWYTLTSPNRQDGTSPLIKAGIDFVESPPGVGKLCNVALRWWSVLANKLNQDPIRCLPLTLWLAYVYVVFFSQGILPGANALQLEPRTWIEVRDLSINFFFVSPLLHFPFSPTVHPLLEAVFNALLAWAALFAGFLSDDDRPNKPSIFPFLPIVIGMQFLTSAFYLPYLVTRSNEPKSKTAQVYQQDLGLVARITESPWWGIVLGGVGIESILWAMWGRMTEYGGGWADRWATFLDLLSVDRVGSSFLVDLVIFALLQGWLIEDDWLRRQQKQIDTASSGNADWLPIVGKYVPFFGLAAYLALRPPLPSKVIEKDS